MYVKYNENGEITSACTHFEEGYELIDEGVQYVNGKIYKSSEVPPPSLEDQLAAIEAEHAAGEELLNKRILGVMLADGQTQAAKIAALQAAYTALANETDAKLRALLPPTEGE